MAFQYHGGVDVSHLLPSVKPATLVIAALDSARPGADYKCNGSNDQETFQEAISELPSTGGGILLLDGTFLVDDHTTIPSNVTIMGLGASSVVKLDPETPTGTHIFENSDPTNGNTRIKITNLKIDGNSSEIAAGNYGGIKLVHSTYCDIESNWITNLRSGAGYSGIRIQGPDARYNIVSQCYCENIIDGHGIFLGTIGYVATDNIVMQNAIGGGSVGAHGIGLYHAERNVIYGNIVRDFPYGIGGLGWCTDNLVMHNLIDSCTGPGIRFSHDCYRNVILGNTCRLNDSQGIYLYIRGSYSMVMGNICYNNGGHGISLWRTDHCSIQGNICYGNGQDADATYDNIIIDESSDNNSLQGNMCRQGVAANKPRYGININSALAENTLVFDNDLRDSGTTANLRDNGTTSKVSRNLGWATENNVLSGTFPIDGVSLETVTIAHGLDMTPALQDCMLTVTEDTDVDDWGFDLLKVESVDAANVVAKINISNASATGGATAKLGLKIDVR